MAIDRWSPFGDMMTLRDAMDRLMQESYVRPGSSVVNATGRTAMPLDVVENDNDYVIYASMPGVKPQDVQITVQGDTLTIRGETSSSMNEPQGSQSGQQTQGQQGQQGQQAQRSNGQGASGQESSGQGQSRQRRSGNYLMRERHEAIYFRQVTLPTNVNADKAQAQFEHGELILTLPKAEEAKPKQIRIQGMSPEGQITSGSKQGQISASSQQGQTSGQSHQTHQATGSQQSQSNEKQQHAGTGAHGS